MQKHRALLADAAGPGGGSGGGGGAGAMAAGGNKVRRGDLRHAVVVRAAKKRQRADGMTVGFDDNACVLITKAGEPLGTRVTGESRDFLLSTAGPRIGEAPPARGGWIRAFCSDRHHEAVSCCG